MKKLITLIAFLSLAGIGLIQAQTQVPNGGYETWTSNYRPSNWWTIDTTVMGMISIRTCYKTTDMHGGSFAARLRSLDTTIFTQNVKIPGLLTLGKLNTTTQMFYGGVPCTDKPDNLRGYLKNLPVSGDTMMIAVFFWKYNSTLHKKDTMGGVQWDTSATYSTYTYFDLPIFWDTTYSGSPDSMNMIMLSSTAVLHNKSMTYVDDLSFYYLPVGIEVKLNDMLENIYPNPSRDMLNIPNEGKSEVSIYSFTGDLLMKVLSSESNIILDLSKFATGIYVLQIRNERGVKTEKLVVE